MGRRKQPKDAPRKHLKRRWTKDECRTLTMAVGAFSIDYIARNTNNRTPKAVYEKISHYLGGGGVSRGTRTERMVAEETGYTQRQIRRAGRALGQRWQRTSTTGAVMLGDDQVEAIVRWLKHDYWCPRAHVYACVTCGRSDIPAYGLGLCHSCYRHQVKIFRLSGLAFARASLLALVAALRERTPVEGRDWLDAFEASLQARCVLTLRALERLRRECVEHGIR